MIEPSQPSTSASELSPAPRRYGAVAGFVAGAVAVSVGMFTAGVIDVVSPIDSVGSEFIDRVRRRSRSWRSNGSGPATNWRFVSASS